MRLYKTRYTTVFVSSLSNPFVEAVFENEITLKYCNGTVRIYLTFHPISLYATRLPLKVLEVLEGGIKI